MMNRISRVLLRTERYLHNPFCFWCGEWMLLFCSRGTLEEMATIEHLQPRKKSGSDEDSNLELVHKRCNR